MDKLGVRTRQKFSSFFSSFTLDTISDKSFGGVRVEYLEAKSAVCGLVCFSSDFVCIGDGRDLLSEARLLADSSANELKAVIGVALFKRGIILRPSFAHSCSVLQSPVRLKNNFLIIHMLFLLIPKFRQMDFTPFSRIFNIQ